MVSGVRQELLAWLIGDPGETGKFCVRLAREAGDPAVAPAAGHHAHPKSKQSGAARGELGRLWLRAERRGDARHIVPGQKALRHHGL